MSLVTSTPADQTAELSLDNPKWPEQFENVITSEKLAIYRGFNGDEDDWQRTGSPKRDILSDGDWNAIRNLIQELVMSKRNLVNKEYSEQICEKLSEMTADKG